MTKPVEEILVYIENDTSDLKLSDEMKAELDRRLDAYKKIPMLEYLGKIWTTGWGD